MRNAYGPAALDIRRGSGSAKKRILETFYVYIQRSNDAVLTQNGKLPNKPILGQGC